MMVFGRISYRGAWAPLLAAAAALLPVPALAGSLQVDPVKVEISADRKVGAIKIKNDASTPVTIRSSVVSWTQAEGADVYGSATSVIVSPPIFTIPAGGTQLVRVGIRGAAAPSNYRLIVEEVPNAGGEGIQVALRLDLPVYVLQKAGSVDQLSWSAWQQADGKWAVEAVNKGAGYVRVQGEEASKHTGLAMKAGMFGTVLPGSTRRWVLGNQPAIVDRAQFQRIARRAADSVQTQLASKH